MTSKFYNFLYNWHVMSDNTVPAGFKSNRRCEFEDSILLMTLLVCIRCRMYNL